MDKPGPGQGTKGHSINATLQPTPSQGPAPPHHSRRNGSEFPRPPQTLRLGLGREMQPESCPDLKSIHLSLFTLELTY